MIRSNSSSEGFGRAEEGIWENKFFASARVLGKRGRDLEKRGKQRKH